MKRTIKTLTLVIVSMVLASCSKSETESTVRFSLDRNNDVAMVTKSSVGDYTTIPSASDFSIVVTDAQGTEYTVTDPSAELTLKTGEYTAKASYGSVSDEGFDKPCFEGEQTFTVEGGKTTNVTISTKLANAMVKMEYTDNFKKYYTDCSFTVTTGKGTQISFPMAETRAAFVDAYLIKVKGSLTNQSGKTQTFAEKEYKNLEAATCYTMKFDASNVGGASISISFNDTVEDVALGEIELND